MEIIRGKHASFINISAMTDLLVRYDSIHIDIGTGDGRFVQHIAQACPNHFVIGIDACRENLHEVSRRAPANALFVIANAQALPFDLYGLAAYITINFPWGSLLEGLITDEPAVLASLTSIAQPNAILEIRLNGGALSEVGWSLEEGANRVREVLAVNGFQMRRPVTLTAHDLRSCPTTWAKRLAFGRDPRAIYLYGEMMAERITCTPYPMRVAIG